MTYTGRLKGCLGVGWVRKVGVGWGERQCRKGRMIQADAVPLW